MSRQMTVAFSTLLGATGIARRLSNDAVDQFKYDGSNRGMTALFERLAADYDRVTGFLWVYNGEHGIGLILPDEIKSMASSPEPLDYDRFLYLMKFIPVPMCLSLADTVNTCIQHFKYTFSSAIKLAAAALSERESELIEAMFYDDGVLDTLAKDMLLLETHAAAFDDPSIKVLKATQSAPRTLREMPLTQYDYMNPSFGYKPGAFVLKYIPNADNQFPAGATITIGSESGVLIKPDSAEADRMVSDIVGTWLANLRSDNGVY